MKKIFDKKITIILIFLIIFGFVLRTYYLNKLSITFMYDQARDAFIVREILNGDLKIQGPSANAPGLYHGVFYFYFLTIPYFIGNGSPVIADIWLSIFNTLTIICVYVLSYYLTKDKKISILSALFFTVSYEINQYATWLSNPSMAIWFVPLTYLFLWLWTNHNRKISAILTGIFFGLSIQTDLFLIYHFIAIFIWIFINRKKIKLSGIFSFLGGLVLGTLPLIVSEIKFGFQGLQGLTYLFSGGDAIVKSKSIPFFINLYINQLSQLFMNNLFPLSKIFASVLGFIMILWLVISWYRSKNINKFDYKLFLILYIFSHLPIVSLGGLNSPYLTVGIGVAVCILASVFLVNLYKKCKLIAILLALFILFSNLNMIFKNNKNGQTIFSIRPQMRLSNLVDVVDYTYKSSNGERFSIDTVTAPLWLNTTWSFVYNWHGIKNYNYLPFWHGKDQVGYWGDNLTKTPVDISLYYFIIEPSDGIPDIYIKQAIDDENSKSIVIEEKIFDGITVQKREKNKI